MTWGFLGAAVGGVSLALALSAQAATFAAKASAQPGFHYLNDTAGTVFTFTIDNTGSSESIGAVEIDRPSSLWTITACPSAPAGWSVQTTADTKCRFRSASGAADNIQPGHSSSQFQVRATTGPGTANRSGTWPVIVSKSDQFDSHSKTFAASSEPPGLGITAYTWEITDAVVSTSTATPGTPCPAANKSAITGSAGHVLVMCGRNHASIALTPVAANSSLAGTFIGSHGTFSSGSIPANSGNVVIGNWSNVTITSVYGPGKTVVAQVGSASNQTSPVTTLTGYEATNRPPVAAADSYSTNEDTQLNVPAPGVLANDTDPDGDLITAVLDAGPTHGSLTLNPDGSFSYTPATDYNGSDSFTYRGNDGISNGNAATVTITVNAVNDAPIAHVPGTQSANEDTPITFSTATSNAVFATDVDAGTGSVVADVTVTHGVLAVATSTGLTPSSLPPAAHLQFSGTLTDVNAALDGLTYTPAADYNGSDQLSFTITDNGNTGAGGPLSDTQTVAISLTPVNDPPGFALPASPNQSVLEDAGAQTVSGFATNISAGPPDESGQALTFHASNTNTSLFSAQPSIDPSTGDLTYTPAALSSGSATVSVYLTDDGGTANGGNDTSGTQTFTITVTGVNHAPSFTLPASPDQTVLEDAGAQTVTTFATNISAGPPNESAQTVTFHVSNDNNALFSTAPDINPSTGDLTYTAAANANGSATVSVYLTDNGGTANGGNDTSGTQTFHINVTAVNDAPSFTLPGSPDQTVLEDAGVQTVSGFATGMSVGPANEAGQTLAFHASNNNNGLFSTQPSVNPSTGDLTYTPAANANGSATVSVYLTDSGGTTNGGNDTSGTQTFHINVTPVNDAPSFTLPGSPNQSVLEDSGSQTVSGFATNISAGPADESGQSLTFHVSNNDNTLFSTQPSISTSTGDLTYTPAAGQTGSATVSVYLTDNGGTANAGSDTSGTQTFTITVHPPNAPPTDIALSPNTVDENLPVGTVVGTLSTTDADAGETFAYAFVTGTGDTDNGSFTLSGDTIQTNAIFNFEAKSTYTIRVQTTDSGPGNLTLEKAITITVNDVNEAPTDIQLSANTIPENSGANAPIGSFTTTDPDTGGTHTYTLVAGTGSDDNASFNITASGGLQENASFNFETKNSYTIRVRSTDNGGLFTEKAFTISVTDVNEAPTDIALSNSSIPENSGANAPIGSFTTTDPDTGDTHTYTLVSGTGSDDNASFNITASGGLQENASFNFETKNSYTIRVRSTDNGGLFTEKAFTISVTDVNEAPTDIALSTNSIDENKPPASAIGTLSATDPDSGQTHSFTLQSSGCSGSFPDNSSFQISGSGLQSAVSFNFEVKNSYTICVRTTDSGSPNLSFDKQFTININDVNDPPVDGNESATAVGNTLLEYGSVPSPSSAAKKVLAGNLLANATDEDQPPQTLTISASDTTSAQGGSVSVSAAGAFSYLPAAGFTGTDTFNYTVSDGNGGTDTSTVTITVGSRVWYVKNNASPGGLGRSTDPFDTLPEADTAANATGDITYVYKGDGTTTGLTGGFSLLANQKLLGEPVNLVVGADTLATGTPANRPSLSGTVALASGSRVEAVDIAGSAGAAIAGTNTGGSDVTNVNLSGGAGGVALTGAAAGTFNFTNFAVNTTGGAGFLVNSSGAPTINVGSGSTENVSATGGAAVDVRNANTASNLSFDAVSSTNSSGAGINLDSNGATPFSASSGSISGAAGNAVDINGGSGNITYPGTLGNGAGNTADITGRSGGAIALSGNINDTSDAGGGITMSGNTGGSTTFSGTTKTLNTGASAAFSSTGSGQTITLSNGGLNIDTTSGAGFTATGGGTVNVTGSSNTIDTTTGTALDVENTTIGASNLTFEAVTANGGSHGIALINTGSSGGLTVTGTGTTDSGGVITGITGADLATNGCASLGSAEPAGVGIYLNNTKSPSFSWMSFPGTFGNFGILGYSVNGFTLDHTTMTGTYGSNVNVDEDTVHFCTLTGSASITNDTISNGAETNLRIVNASGTLNRLTMTSDTIGLNQSGGGDGTLVEADGGTLNATVEDSVFQGSRGSPFQAVPQAGATMDLVFGAPGHGNTIHNTHTNIVPFAQDLNVAAGGNLTFDINSNHFDSASAVQAQGGVFINAANSTAVASGYFRNNSIGNSGVANSGSSGNDPALDVESNGGGDLTISITNNQMYQWGSNGAGFLVQAGATSGSPTTFNVTVSGNTVAQPGTFAVANNAQGFQLNNGTQSGENFTSCLNLASNTMNGSGTGAGGDIRIRQRFDTKVDMPGYTGAVDGGTLFADVINYVKTKNPTGPPSVSAVSSTAAGGGFFNTPGGAGCALPTF